MAAEPQHAPLAQERLNVNEALAVYEQGWFEHLATKDAEIAQVQRNLQELLDENKWLRENEVLRLTAENDRLIRENDRLSRENDELRRDASAAKDRAPQIDIPATPTRRAQTPNQRTNATAVGCIYSGSTEEGPKIRQLRSKVESQKTAIDAITGKYLRLKDTAERWREYANKLEARQISSRARRSSGGNEPVVPAKKVIPPTQLLDDITRGLGLGFPVLSGDSSSESGRSSSLPALPIAPTVELPAVPNSPVRTAADIEQIVRSSQGETSGRDAQPALAHSSGDETVVSETDQDPVRVKLEKDGPAIRTPLIGSIVEPIQVKSEPGSSPIIISQTSRPLVRTLTMDLDEVGARTKTPRRKRKWAVLNNDLPEDEEHQSLHEERSFSAPVEGPLAGQIPGGIPDHLQIQTTRNFASDPGVKAEADEEDVDRTLVDDEDLFASGPVPEVNVARPLQLIDNNERSLPGIPQPATKARKVSTGSRLNKRLDHLLEDGSGAENDDGQQPAPKRAKAGSRLNDLLNEPVLQRPAEPLIAPRSPPSRTRTPGRQPDFPRMRALLARRTPNSSERTSSSRTPSEPNEVIPATVGPASVAKSFPAPANATRTPANTRSAATVSKSFSTSSKPRGPSLRSKPLSALNLGDFKLNPRALPASDPETVKQAREHLKHLPNCTDPNCSHGCGAALRALAVDLTPVIPRTLFSSQDSDTNIDISDSQANERRLLKWHLGRSYENAVANLTSDEREQLVLDAKVKLLAERHGKHRVRVDKRQRTPPGFWDTEMPSTMEVEKTRREREVVDREEVRERWREAMREGGLWTFRDE